MWKLRDGYFNGAAGLCVITFRWADGTLDRLEVHADKDGCFMLEETGNIPIGIFAKRIRSPLPAKLHREQRGLLLKKGIRSGRKYLKRLVDYRGRA